MCDSPNNAGASRRRRAAIPCAECPYTLGRTQGYTGPYRAEELHSMASGDTKLPCHMTMKSADPARCRGLDLYRAEIAKQPRDPEEARAQRQTVEALAGGAQAVPAFGLVEYHTLGDKMKSISTDSRPGPLSGREIDGVIASMPEGEAGFLKTWGLHQFAAGVEEALRHKGLVSAAPQPAPEATSPGAL